MIDGDTFIADGQRYRIWGADAPEKEEPYYHTARLYMESLILDESLTCNTIDIGKYGRYVVRCYLGHQDIAAEIINAGLARDDSSFSNHYYQREEARAQKNKIGLWAP